jgi:hypothetical protein
MRLSRRTISTVTLVIFLLHSSVIASLQSELVQTRSELEAVLADRNDALEKDDRDRILSFYTPTFEMRFGGGRILTLQDLKQLLSS